ncbi:MAG: T9SS type A sorting domain-containing protein [Bacteroidia bacterium]
MKKFTLLAVAIVMFIAIAKKSNAGNVTWNNASGGNWSLGTNWSNGSGPGTNDTAVITLNGTYTVDMDANVTCQKIVLGGATGRQTLTVSSKTITINKGALINDNGIVYAYATTFTGNNPLVNNGKIELSYNNTFNLNITNNDTIEVWHQYNYINQSYSANAGSVLKFTCNEYYSVLTFANGFTNNGSIEFNSITNYGCDLYITSGTLTNASNGTIISQGIYNPVKNIHGNVTNNGNVTCNQDLNFTDAGFTFLNSNIITIAAGKNLTNSANTFTNNSTINFAATAILTNTNNTFTYAGSSTAGAGEFYFNGAIANFNTANIPGHYLEFYGSTLNSTQSVLTNSRKLRFIYNNTVNANLFNKDSIYVSHQYNTIAGNFTTSAASRIFLDGNNYYTQLTFSNGFINNGEIEFNSVTNYGLDLYVTAGVLTNASGAFIKSKGIYNPAKTITGSVTNNGSVICDQDLTIGGGGSTFLNSNIITIAAGKNLTNSANTFTHNGVINFAATAILTNTNNTFTYAGTSTANTGEFYFNGSTANFNTANIPGHYLEFYGSTLNSTQNPLTNSRKLRFIYNNTVNANLFNKDSIYASHQYNTIAGNFTTSAASRIFLDGNSYYTQLTFTDGFINNGQIEFNSVTNYGLDLYITNGVLTNASGAFIKSTGIYNPAKTITGSVTNNGSVICDQDLTFSGGGNTFLNNNIINIASGKNLTNSSNTFTYAAGSTPGLGGFIFNSAIANFNVSTMPGKYLEFNQSTLASTYLPITNGRKLRFNNSNSINAAVFNTDTIYISHYNNYMLGALTTSAASRIIFDCSQYIGGFTVSKGFTNNGKIIFNSISGYYGSLSVDSNLIINAASGEIWSAGITSPNYIYASVNNTGLITTDQSLVIQKTDTSLNTGAINIASGKYLKYATGKLKFNGGTASGPGKLVFENCYYEENLSNMPNLLTEFNSSTLASNAALLSNYGTLQFFASNTITANVKNKSTGIIKFSHYNNLFNGNFSTEAGSLVSIDAEAYIGDVTFLNGFTNNGTIDLRSISGYGSSLTVTNGELLNNTAGVIHAYEVYATRYLYAQLNNKGTVTVDRDFTIQKNSAAHQNVTGGNVSIAAAATLTIQNAGYTLSGGSITGAGFLTFDNCTYTVGVTNFPAVYHKFYTSKVEAPAVVGNATTLQFFNGDSIKASINNKSGGVMKFSHYINTMTGILTTNANSLLSVDAESYVSDVTIVNSFTNKGTIELKSVSGYSSALTIQNGVLINDTNATFNVLTPYSTRYYYGQLLNNGTLNVSHDPFYVTSSSFVNSNIGLLKGTGGIYLSGTQLVNNGTISPGSSPGILGVTAGDAKSISTSNLNIEIGGPTAGTQHDQFNVTSIDSINGNLNVTLINGYVPALGDSFIVSNYGTRVGTFSNVTGTIPGGLAWNIFYRTNYVVIRAGNPTNLTITSSAGANGTISPLGAVTVTYNGSKTFTMSPNATYQIDSVIVDGNYTGTSSTYTFNNVTVNHTISVKFKTSIANYTINASKTGSGTISPTGAVSVTQGGSQNFTFTPNNTCTYIDSVIVDGTYVGAPGSYNFTNVQANHTIKAVFKTGTSVQQGSAVAVCSGDSTSVSAGNGYTGYLWSNGKTSQSIYIKTAGTYTVTVTGSGGCTNTSSVTLTVNPLATVTFTNPYSGASGHVCYTDGAATLNGFGTPAGGSFSGNGVGSNVGIFYFSPSTSYGSRVLTYSYTNANGCSKSVTQTVIVDSNATVSAGANKIKCGNLAVQVAGTKGGSATSVTWTTSGTGTFNNASSLTPTYTLSSADATNGGVTLTITTNNPSGQCGAVSDQMVITYYQNAVADAGNNAAICVTSPIAVSGSITGYPLATPLWTTTGTGTFANATALSTTYTASGADNTAGTVKLILTPIDPNGQCTFTGDTLEIWFDKYTVGAGVDQVLCGTSVATLAGTKSGAGSTITWTTNGTGNFSNANSLTSNYTLSAADKINGGVTLTITTNNPTGPCGPKTDQMIISYRAATADAGPVEVCGDTIWQLSGTYSGTPGTLVSPVWSSLGTGSFNNVNIFNPVYTASAADKTAGNVRLVLHLNDAIGTCSNFVNDTIKVWFNPHYSVNAGVDTVYSCADKQVQLAGSKVGATSVVWTSSGSGTFNNASSLTPKYTFSNADTTAHKVTLYITSNDPSGPCGTVVDSIKVIIYSLPAATAGTNSPVCISANLNLTASGGSNYSWVGPNAYTSTLQNIIRSNADVTMAGTYTVTITNANGCSATATTTATIINCGCIPPIVLMGKTDVSCFGGSNGTSSTTVNNVGGPFTYLWNNGATTKDVTGLAAGTYTVTVSTSISCSSTATVTIAQPTVIVLNPVSTNSNCSNANGSVQMNVSGGTPAYSFLWNTVPAQSTSVISSMLPGTYTCTVTDANGCTKTKSATIINVGSAITGLTITNKRPCFGLTNGKLTLKTITGGTAPYTYLWNTGNTTTSISNLAPATYTITVTDANGCSFVKATFVQQRSEIICHTTVTNATCGFCNGQVVAAPTGGVRPYRYSWNTVPVSTDSVVTGLCAGIYTLTITDTANCKTTCTVTVLDGSPVVTIDTITNVLCNGNNTGSVKILVSGGVSPYTYLWSNGKTVKNNLNVTAGTYTVTVTGSNSCTKTLSAIVTQPAALGITFTTTTTSATCNPTGGKTPYSYLWNNGKTTKTISNLTAGNTYTVTVTDANLCTKTTSLLFTGLRVGSVSTEDVMIDNINLYPNPTDGIFNLSFTSSIESAEVCYEIRDALGRIVIQKKVKALSGLNQQIFNIENLYDGVYELRILSGSYVSEQRIILRK